jgi:hypothetical protein
MIGWDFSIFWEIGRAVLEGRSPYAVEFSRYPPAAAFLFVIFAFLPFTAAFAAWTGLNVALYIHRLRRMKLGLSGWVWLLYTPFLFNILTGQLDILFWWAAMGLRPPRQDTNAPDPMGASPANRPDRESWIPVLAAAFITLKPQLAAVVLPWYLVRWLLHERGLLLRWVGITALLHALPLVFDPGIYGKWLAALAGVSEMKMGVSGGIFAFGLVGLPFWLLAVIGLILAAWGLFQDELTSRAAQLTAFPITIWYDDVLLAGIGPVRWMVALSWLVFVGAFLVENSLPLVMIPVAALGWLVYRRNRLQRTRRDEPGS